MMNKQSPFKKMIESLINKTIPQSQPLDRAGQVAMRSGGYGFALDEDSQLNTLLIMGSDGSFYESADMMQARHAELLIRLIRADGEKVVARALDLSEKGLPLKNTYPLFALAATVAFGSPTARQAALKALPLMARTASDLLFFVAAFSALGGGWGRAVKRAVNQWYTARTLEQAVYQVLKYQNRHEWRHKDVVRLSHLRADVQKTQPDPAGWAMLLAWLRGEEDALVALETRADLHQLAAFERVKTVTTASHAAEIIRQHRLTHEMTPTEWMESPLVWEALLEGMPYTALIRTLNRITLSGLLEDDRVRQSIIERLTNADVIRKARVHPLNILIARATYGAGKGLRGSLTWQPDSGLLAALDSAFYMALGAVEKRDARTLVAIDVSGSMGGGLPNKALSLHEATSALALTVKRKYSDVDVTAVDIHLYKGLPIRPDMTLADAYTLVTSYGGGGTSLNLVFEDLIKTRQSYDAILFLTDSESWAGNRHTQVAWEEYRKTVAPNARLLYVGMAANEYWLGDSTDASVRFAIGFDPTIFSIFDLMLDGLI